MARLYSDLVEGSLQGIIVVDRNSEIVFTNDTFVEMMGYPSARAMIDLCSADLLLAPHERERVANIRQARLAGQDAPTLYEAEATKKNGTAIWLQLLERKIEWNGEPAAQITLLDISERKRAEEAARRSEERLQVITDAMPALISYVDRDSKYRFVNKTYEQWFGLSRDEIIGRHIMETLGDENYARIRKGGELALSGERVTHMSEIMSQNAGLRSMCVELIPDFEDDGGVRGYFVMTVDVTELKQRERDLRDSEARLSTTLESVVEGIVTIDAAGTIDSFNPMAERMFGYSSEEAIGQNVSILMAEDDSARHDEAVERYLRTGESQIIGASREVMGRRKNGETFPLELGVAEMRLGDERHFVGSLRDITLRKRFEEELQQTQKMESLGQLTGGVAHDFNNLLFTIGGNLDLLVSELGSDNVALPYIDAIIKACDRGATLTQHLLAFSRKQTLMPETVRVDAILKTIVELLQRALGENIQVVLTIAPDTGLTRIDPGQLQSALLNLAVNARDAMTGGGRLRVEARNVTLDEISAKRNEGARAETYIRIRVADTGTGMPPDVARRAFDPFFTTKGVGKGTGLGLSMIYGFVQQSGGFVTLDSVEGSGTTVDLYLPLAVDGEETGFDDTIAITGGSESILLVEDDADVRAVATGMLVNLGYRVIEAADGPQALTIADKGVPFDLLMTDVILPGAPSGPELAAMLGDNRKTLKVLFMSGYSGEHVEALDKLGDSTVLLTKPFRRDELARAVRKALADIRTA